MIADLGIYWVIIDIEGRVRSISKHHLSERQIWISAALPGHAFIRGNPKGITVLCDECTVPIAYQIYSGAASSIGQRSSDEHPCRSIVVAIGHVSGDIP